MSITSIRGLRTWRPCPRRGATDRYKLIHFFIEAGGVSSLYDLKTDPDEMNNLYGKAGYEEITAHLKERLAELRRETKDTYELTSRRGYLCNPGIGGGAESDLVRQPK